MTKIQIKDNIIDFKIATYSEICSELGMRLKIQRLLKNLKQQDLAAQAGVAVGTVKNLEAKGQCSLETLVRIVIALDLSQELAPIFTTKVQSILQMEELERLTSKKIPKRAR
jgi:transcriptional regulator with XRE-family HTH domain